MKPFTIIAPGIAAFGIQQRYYGMDEIAEKLLDKDGYVNVPPSFVRIMQGRAGAAILLSFLAGHQANAEKEFSRLVCVCHSSEYIEATTGLSYQVQKKSRQTLASMGLITEVRRALSSIFFHVNEARLIELIQLDHKNSLPKFTKAGLHFMKIEDAA